MKYGKIYLSSPVDLKFPVTSPFGVDRPDIAKRFNQKKNFHKGVDFGSARRKGVISHSINGSLVYSVLSGKAQLAGWENEEDHKQGFGQRLWVLSHHPTHGDIRICYAHLSDLFVGEGNNIDFFQAIGRVGTTGRSTGPHLHIQVEKWPSREVLEPIFEKVS